MILPWNPYILHIWNLPEPGDGVIILASKLNGGYGTKVLNSKLASTDITATGHPQVKAHAGSILPFLLDG